MKAPIFLFAFYANIQANQRSFTLFAVVFSPVIVIFIHRRLPWGIVSALQKVLSSAGFSGQLSSAQRLFQGCQQPGHGGRLIGRGKQGAHQGHTGHAAACQLGQVFLGDAADAHHWQRRGGAHPG